jgi:hypothetical protein
LERALRAFGTAFKSEDLPWFDKNLTADFSVTVGGNTVKRNTSLVSLKWTFHRVLSIDRATMDIEHISNDGGRQSTVTAVVTLGGKVIEKSESVEFKRISTQRQVWRWTDHAYKLASVVYLKDRWLVNGKVTAGLP